MALVPAARGVHAAAAITGVTILAFPASFVYFGILRAIAAATLIGTPFLRAPGLICLAVGSAFFVKPNGGHRDDGLTSLP